MVRWDSEGRVYFTDRIGDTFRWKSENVSTAEVAHILGSHPAVHEANVYGVQLPHHEGRAGCAAVIFAEGQKVDEETLKDIAAHVSKNLPKYALPLFLRVIDGTAMQTTGTNKQQKHNFRNDGVDPERTGSDAVYWLRNGMYVRFTPREWTELNGGRVRL